VITVTLYSKDNCSLCDVALQDLEALQKSIPHNLAIVDIESDPALKKTYGERVPVLQAGPYTLEAPFDRPKIEMTLAAARDRMAQMKDDPKFKGRKERGTQMTRSDNVGSWLSRNYLALINFVLVLYLGLPFLAPVLMNAGMPSAARPIYSIYGAVCHQMAFRSWFLFGDQAVYPRGSAGIEGLSTYESATGLDPENLIEARRFIGNEELGYKVAFCQRDVAIYGGMLLFGLIYAGSKKRVPPLHWAIWVAVGMGPIAVDGFSQLLSQIPRFELWDYRESTPLLRTFTGAVFGFLTAWFGFPLLEDSFEDTRVTIASKKARLEK
jgi:uncharacterized membrane protein